MTTDGHSKYEPYGVAVLESLGKKSRSKRALQKVVNDVARTMGHAKIPSAYNVIYWLRGETDDAVITYDRSLRLYSIAETRVQAEHWLNGRKRNIRTQIARTLRATVVTRKTFGNDAELRLIEGGLKALLEILDAGAEEDSPLPS